MWYDVIEISFAPVVGLLILLVFLLAGKKKESSVTNIFWGICFLELLELIVSIAELWTASLDHPTALRILFSAIGYTIRPLLMYGLFRLTARRYLNSRQLGLFLIPAVLNTIAAFSAFFTDIVYSYNEANVFVRGTLGYTPHIILAFYLVCILICSFLRYRDGQRLECAVLWLICASVLAMVVVEALLPVHTLGRMAIILATIAYYMFFQTQNFRNDLKEYIEQTMEGQREHLREMNIISMLAKEYVTICYVDVEHNNVIPYRMDPYIEENYGDILRLGTTFEKVFRAYAYRDVLEEDRAFFAELSNLSDMIAYLQENGSLSHKYRVLRGDNLILYCEMRAELVPAENGATDIVFGFSNNDNRVRKEMVYQSAMETEIEKIASARNILTEISDLAIQLHDTIEEKLSSF